MESALKKIRRWLKARRLDALLVRGPENRRYLSGFTPPDTSITESSGCLLISHQSAYLLTDGRFIEEAKEILPPFVSIIYKKGVVRELARLVKKEGLKALAYEEDFVSCALKRALEAGLTGVRLVGCQGIIERLREAKTEEEIEKIHRALKIAEDILRDIGQALKPGVSEKEIAWKIIEASFQRAEGPSFPPIVAFGENAARPHAEPGSRRLTLKDPIIIDMGVKFSGYCSDITRSYCLQPDDKYRHIYNLVAEAQETAQKAIKAKVPARVIDAAAREVIKKAGLGRYFIHSLGHGVGLAIHEAPGISSRCRRKLKEGAVVTIEPGIYIPDWGGVRLENMVVVRKEEGLLLNRLPLTYQPL